MDNRLTKNPPLSFLEAFDHNLEQYELNVHYIESQIIAPMRIDMIGGLGALMLEKFTGKMEKVKRYGNSQKKI